MSSAPRKKGGFLLSPVTLIFVGIITLYILFQVFGVYGKKQYTETLLEESKTYHESVSKSLLDIEERSALLDDLRGKEAYLREKEGFLLPGEEVYVIVNAPTLEATSTAETGNSWIQKILPSH
jgi:hypothetical protein